MGMRTIRRVHAAVGTALLLAATGAFAATNSGCQTTTCDSTYGPGGAGPTVVTGSTGNVNTTLSNALPSGNNQLGGGSSANGTSRFALNSRDTGTAAAGAGSKWNTWLSLSQNNVAYNFAPQQSSGRVNLTLVGVDYTFANNLIFGVAAGWDQTRVGTSFNGGNVNANGNIIAPYLSWRIAQGWNLDASVGAGRSNVSQTDNSVPGGITGNYTDRRTIGSLSISYARMFGKWQLTGRGSYLAGQDKLSSFTLSNGTTIAENTNKTGQLRAGGQAMYNGGMVLPYVGLYYFNDVQRVSQASVGGQTPANDRDGFQAQLGVQFAPRSPVYGGLMVATDIGRKQVKNDLFLANIGIRF